MTEIDLVGGPVDEEHCNECGTSLTGQEREFGYICFDCIESWRRDAYHAHSHRELDEDLALNIFGSSTPQARS